MPTTTIPSHARSNGSGTSTSTQPAVKGATARAAARNRSRVILGVLVLVASSLVGGLLYADLGNRSEMLAVARPVAVGQVIKAADLHTVLAADVDGVDTLPGSSLASVVGRTAAVALVPGTLLSPAQLSDGPVIDPTAAIVGAVLKPGQFPLGLRQGDRVLAVPLPSEAAASSDDTEPGTPIAATVAAVEPLDDSGGSVSVSLAVPLGDAPSLAVAGARGRLSLVLAPR